MKTPKEIYEAYKIMPNLQLHQLRVAAVGSFICNNLTVPVDAGDVVLACLFHDMGNILKFDLTIFPESVQPEGLEYWEGIKGEYAKKYGEDQHVASLAIAKEIGLSDQVIQYIDLIAFSKAEQTLCSKSWEEKICEYADSRVAPFGITSLAERFEDGRKRYMGRVANKGIVAPRERFDELIRAEHEIEQQIFSHAKIKPEDITDAAIAPFIEELSEYTVA